MQVKTTSTLPFTGKMSFNEFQEKIKIFDFIKTLMSLQKLSTFMSNQTSININLEFEFHIVPKVRHQIVLSKDFIPFFAKLAILNCVNSTIEYNDLDLTNLAYQYGNMEIDLNYTDSTSKDARLWVLRATNHQWFYLRLTSSIIGRYVYLFREVFNIDGNFKTKIDNELNIEFFNLLKIGTCISANFCPRPGGFATSFEMSKYTNIKDFPLLTEENINKFMGIFAIDQKHFKEEYKKHEINDPLLKKYEFNPLKRFPIIKTDSKNENEKFIIPSLADFLYACFEGMYYVLLDKLDKKDKNVLFEYFGKAFEKYIGELIIYYNLPLFSKGELLSEQTYTNKTQAKSADWLLISDEYIFQIECKKRKLDNYSKAGIESEDKGGISSFLGDIAKELDKLVDKETHIKNGKITKIKYINQKIINIIVYLDEMFAINEYARNEIKSKMTQKTDNFYILGCWEFEMLCQHVNNKNLNLKDALDDLIKKRIELYSIDFLDKTYHDFFDTIMK